MILAQGSNSTASGNRVSQPGSNGFGLDHRHQKQQLFVSAPAQLQTTLEPALACQEEITSIFVMGFPDDMKEREFMNMFTFCPGFEGAKLKIPPQLVGGNSNQSLNAGSAASCVGLDDTSSDSFSSSSSSKKQCSSIIGFAKFRTREQALIAIQVLTGRKVDQEKYNVLKAEFAKKDLHIRKAYIDSNQEHQLPRTLSSLLSIQLNNSGNTSNNASNLFLSQGSSSFEGDQWANLSVYNPARTPTTSSNTILPHSVPKFTPNRSMYIPEGFFGSTPYTAPVGSEVSVDNEYFDLPPRVPQSFTMMQNDAETPLAEIPNPDKFLPANLFSDKDSTKDVPLCIVDSLGVEDQPADKSISSPVTGRVLIGNQNLGFESALYHNLETSFATLSAPIANQAFSQESKPEGVKQHEHHTEQSTKECSEDSTHITKTERLNPSNASTPHLKMQAFEKPNSNPYLIHNTFVPVKPLASDQNNPPCNTLYVGNLPMNAHENELKDLFSVCPGYKRLCFRTKNNGPMCFVEFESIDYATKAMHSLYGTLLSNSTKGGIRLSFSKNPLGIRLNTNTTTTTSSGNASHHSINTSSFNKQKSHNNLSGTNLSHDHHYGGMVSVANSAWGKQQQHHYH